MLHDAISTRTAAPPAVSGRPVLGGDAWVVPPAVSPQPWVGQAPEISITDRRRKAA